PAGPPPRASTWRRPWRARHTWRRGRRPTRCTPGWASSSSTGWRRTRRCRGHCSTTSAIRGGTSAAWPTRSSGDGRAVLAASRRLPPFRGRPARVEGMSGLIEIDDEGRVIRGHGLALPGLAIDLGPDHACRERLRDEQVVDAHPEVLVEAAGAIVPPGVAAGLGPMHAIGVDQSPVAEPGEGKPLRLRHVRSTVARHGIPDVRVRRGDVVVAAECHGLAGVTRLDEPPCETVEPRELGPIEGRVERSPVRRIEAHDPDAAADG